MSFVITNGSNRAATDFEVIIDSLSLFQLLLTTRNCQITTVWGVKIQTSILGKYILKPDSSILIKPGKVIISRHFNYQTYSTLGICGKANQKYSITGSVTLIASI